MVFREKTLMPLINKYEKNSQTSNDLKSFAKFRDAISSFWTKNVACTLYTVKSKKIIYLPQRSIFIGRQASKWIKRFITWIYFWCYLMTSAMRHKHSLKCYIPFEAGTLHRFTFLRHIIFRLYTLYFTVQMDSPICEVNVLLGPLGRLRVCCLAIHLQFQPKHPVSKQWSFKK